MTVRTKPWIIDGNTHPAQDARIALAASLGCDLATAFAGGVSAVDPGHGVTYATDLKVAQNGTPNMSVNVAAGAAFIRGTISSFQGVYSVSNDATLNLTIAAANGTNPRRDLVIFQARDNAFDSGGINDARLLVVTGTPAASPTDPSLSSYPNALVLARVSVAAGATSITNANIADLRTGVGDWFRPKGYRAHGTNGTTSSANPGTVGLLGASAFVAEANRRYRITIGFYDAVIVGSGVSEVQVRRGASAIKSAFVGSTAGTYPGRSVVAFDVPGAGSVTYNFYTFTNATSLQVEASSSAPFDIYVEDAGGVLA